MPEATYLAWLDMRGVGLGDDPAAVLLDRGRVALTGGRPFGRGGLGHARVNLACSVEVLTEAVERMVDAVAAHVGAGGPGRQRLSQRGPRPPTSAPRPRCGPPSRGPHSSAKQAAA